MTMTIDGNGSQDQVRQKLPEKREAIIAQATRMQQEIQEDRDRLSRDLVEYRTLLAEANVKIESLNHLVAIHQQQAEALTESLGSLTDSFKSQIASMQMAAEDQIRRHRDERDHAVDEMNRCKVILTGISAQLQAHDAESAGT